MHKEYKHPTPYRPDFNYLEGIYKSDEHIKNLTNVKGGPHQGQAQHLGGMASYRNHLEKLHYGPGEKIKKDLKRVLDYLFYYSKTDHDIYHFLAEDALMHMDQMVTDIQDPAEKEHIRYFVECVREYMAWLKTPDAKKRNKNQEYGENRENSGMYGSYDQNMNREYGGNPGMNDQYNWERNNQNRGQNMGEFYNNPNDWNRNNQNRGQNMGPSYNNPNDWNRGQGYNDQYRGNQNDRDRNPNMRDSYDNRGQNRDQYGQNRSQGMNDQSNRNDRNRGQDRDDRDGRGMSDQSNRNERDGQESSGQENRNKTGGQSSDSKDSNTSTGTQQKGIVNL